MSWWFVVFTVAVVCFLGAMTGLMLARWRRGRRVGDVPTCAGCGFELGFRPGGRCPECGCDLSRRWAWTGARRREERFLALAVLMLVCLGVYLAAGNVGLIRKWRAEWVTLESVLVRRAGEDDSAALAEITRRLELGQVSRGHLSGLIDGALARQCEKTGARWNAAWGTLVETAWAKGRLAGAEWERYCRQALPVQPEFFASMNGAGPFLGCSIGPTRTGGTEWSPWARVAVVAYEPPGEEVISLADRNPGSIRGGGSSMQARMVLVELSGSAATSARVRLRVEAIDWQEQVVTSWEVEGERGLGPMR